MNCMSRAKRPRLRAPPLWKKQNKTQFWDRDDWSVAPQITVVSERRGETDHIRRGEGDTSHFIVGQP